MSGINATKPKLIVAIGASAGGLESFSAFFAHMPNDSNIAFVLLPHLDPTHNSLMPELISKTTAMPVCEAIENMQVQGDHVYILPPGKLLFISDGRLHLSPNVKNRTQWIAIEYFLRSLALDQGEHCVAIILSGTGNHGTLSFRDIKLAGGMIIAQDPASTTYNQMPINAINSGLVDVIARPENMPILLTEFSNHPYLQSKADQTDQQVFNCIYSILSLLHSRTGYDFSGYRKNMLLRRIQRRMCVCHTETIQDYHQFMKNNPTETSLLNKDLLIGVTAFFRDEEAFSALETHVFPELVARSSADNPVRIWIPACATGEEVYTITLLMFEAFDQAKKQINLQVFASDIDEKSINVARSGIYAKNIAEIISAERLAGFFDVTNKGDYQIKKVIREKIIFSNQNLLNDAPFSRLDLISCRNLFIYLQPELQANVLDLFYVALKTTSYLMLGPSESLGKNKHKFVTISKKWRIFKKIKPLIKSPLALPVSRMSTPNISIDQSTISNKFRADSPSRYNELVNRDLLAAYAPAAVLINRSFEILHYQGPTVNFLEFPKGSPSNDLLVLLREGLRARVRSAINYVQKENQAITDHQARVKRNNHYVTCTLTVRPVYEPNLSTELLLITFEDKHPLQNNSPKNIPVEDTLSPPLPDQYLIANSDTAANTNIVTQLEYELNATREDLYSTVQELENSNEDLQVSNEEAMSMNEELQSTNEELETSKEELQSMNEELNTVNTELQYKVEELERSYNDISNLLSSTDIATVFLNRDMQVMLFNPPIGELLNLRESDIGRPISNFSANVSNKALMTDAKKVLETLTPIETDVWSHHKDQKRRCYLRRIVPYRTLDDHINGVVITFVDITERHHQKQILEQCVQERTHALHEREARLSAIMNYAFEAILVLDLSGKITEFNDSAQTMFNYNNKEIIGKNIQALIPSINIKQLTSQAHTLESSALSTLILAKKELIGLRKNALDFPIALSLTKVKGRALYIGIINDLSEPQALKKALINISTYEQEKIGHEIHDNLGQRLTGINLLASNLKRSLPKSDIKNNQAMDLIIEQLSQAIGDTRDFSHILAPILLPPHGLQDALTTMMKLFDSSGIKKKIKLSSNLTIVDSIVTTQVYRIAQEAINNTLKHAKARKVTLQLQAQGENTCLEITDDGLGFDINDPKFTQGIGIQIMRYRASNINATLDIVSSKGKGTSVRCVF
ncbi:PAS domain-containing protein [Colwellia sp. MB3u-70]|uniref:CheR family methyltransferase n=1 Tax=unclassified Colwellia TaxID=196834 RepID=UPI0015F37EE7|nr:MULTISPECIES: CheR family methyltransferase [unclassified Colwellia]MBA6292111.1 PAS domain-containing protein [Colwellia sp. MB3u-8]MBA6309094.1 PAS domain-containing protein [Colwellia sp. MB3u-70]